MKIRSILIIFIPAIAVAAFALFASFIQYQPKRIPFNNPNKPEILNIVPIYAEDIILGNLKAGKTIIAFEDLGCSHCQDQMLIFDELLSKYPGRIKIILKTLNVIRFPFASDEAHKYLFCANEQNKVNDFKSLVLEDKRLDSNSLNLIAVSSGLNTDALESCITDSRTLNYTQKNEALAKNLGIESVPTIFINNKVIQEPLSLSGWESILSLSN
ncbi:MAG: thioredoxin domain-containing protein [bacterium]|nr:thioredoxin domain-containing protein [bacterium]